MKNYYQILGLNSSATKDEVRRAYRILARRYHPDVNPGKDSSEKFKSIAEAYRVLNDAEQRRKYDSEFELQQSAGSRAKMRSYTENARQTFQAQSRAYARQQEARRRAEEFTKHFQTERGDKPKRKERAASPTELGQRFLHFIKKLPQKRITLPWKKTPSGLSVQEVSIIEVSVLVSEAIFGIRKTVEVLDGENTRKLSVQIPPGVRTGSVVRMRNKQNQELVLIIQVAHHPLVSIDRRGVVVELPVTPEEALLGANIKVPTLEEPVMLKIPSGSQSGTYIRLRGKGAAPSSSGARGDLFYRLEVRLPDGAEQSGVGEAARYLSDQTRDSIRKDFPTKLFA